MKLPAFFLGLFFVLLAFIGVFLPLLPTTPFALLAAYFFARSSPKAHAWLLKAPWLGDVILQWQKHRAIRPRAKISATVMIVSLFSYTLLFVQVPIPVKIVVSAIGIAVLSFIWTRKSS
jgi:uncharacterized protein